MRLKYPALVLTFWSAWLLPTANTMTPVDRSVSTSRQFLVHGGDVRLRGAVCDLAEQVKKELLSIIQQRDDWKLPIVIRAELAQANLPDAPPAANAFSQTEAGLKLQLDLAIRADVNVTDVEREILRALLLELAYRDHPGMAPGTAYAQPPEWLLEGLIARQPNEERSRTIKSLSTVAAANKIAPLADVLAQRSELLNPSSRAIYRAYSLALVETLTSGAGSGPRFGAMIKDLTALSLDPLAVIAAHFPPFAHDVGLAWDAAIKRLLLQAKDRLLSVAETEAELDRLLALRVATKTKPARNYRLDDFAAFIREPGAPDALQQASRDFVVLGTRANPIYRPIVEEYRQITSLLAQRKTNRIAARLAHARSVRVAATEQCRHIDDYLNWFEATQGRGPSGLFADYLKAARQVDETRPPRRDAISVYLTKLETEL